MLTAAYCVLAGILMIPSDRAHRTCLAAVIGALLCLYVIGGLAPEKLFYPVQAVVWLAVAWWMLTTYPGWKFVRASAILLIVAGVSVFPAWLGGSPLVAFTDHSLFISGIIGVSAILCLGSPGLGRVGSWLWDLGGNLRGGRASYSLRLTAKEQATPQLTVHPGRRL